MPFTPRPASTITSDALGILSAQYAAQGRTIVITPGSDPWLWFSSLAVELENLEAQAQANALLVLPDKADTATLNRYGAVYGLPRKVAVAAVLSLAVTGADATYAVAGKTLSTPDGLQYTVTTATVVVTGGTGTLSVTCTTAGSAGTKAAGTVLAWSSAPAGLDPTATVASVSAPGINAETDPAYASRIIAQIQGHPASGNRGDLRGWALACAGVASAYAYPLLDPSGNTGVPGCVSVCILGPVGTNNPPSGTPVQNGDAPQYTAGTGRFPASGVATNVAAYIEGTKDAAGNVVSGGTQLRPVTIPSGNYTIASALRAGFNITVQITTDATVTWSWPTFASLTIDASSDATHLVVSGDATALNGCDALVPVPLAAIRGGYQRVTLPVGVYNGGTGKTTFTFSAAPSPPFTTPPGTGYLLGAPQSALLAYPCPSNWQALRLAAFAYIDTLGPGDALAPSSRWPTESVGGGAKFYRSALQGALIQMVSGGVLVSGVSGVVAATVTSPGGDVGAAPLAVCDVDWFVVTKA